MTNTTKNHDGNCDCTTCTNLYGPALVESPGLEPARKVDNVPRGAEFQFGWNGYDFFTTTQGELIATPK